MNTNEAKAIVTAPNTTILSESISLFQRNLASEGAAWLRQVEIKAKQLKKGKVVLIAVIKDD